MNGTRSLHDGGLTCAALADAVALSAALLLDEAPRTFHEHDEPARSPREHGAAGRDQAVSESLAHAKILRAYAALGAALGIVRPVALAFTAGASVVVAPRLSLGLSATWVPTHRVELAPGAVGVSLVAAGPTICARTLGDEASTHADACVSLAFGRLHAAAHGFTDDGRASRAWIAPSGGVRASGRFVGPMAWTTHVDAFLPVTTEAFAVEHVGIAYAPPRFGLVVGAGVAVETP